MNKSILITGGAGLLGSRLADWIIENKKEYDVVIVDNLSGGYVENINSKAHFYRLDCTDTFSINELFELHKPEYVYHLAAYAAEGLSPFIR